MSPGTYFAASGLSRTSASTAAATASTCAPAAPVKDCLSASAASGPPVQRQPRVGRSRSSRSGSAPRSASQGDRDGVLFDHLVGDLPVHAGPHRGDEHLWWSPGTADNGRAHAGSPRGRHRTPRAPWERLDHAVDGEERVGQRHPADNRAEDVALIPLRPSQFRGHRGVAQHDLQPVDSFQLRVFILCGIAEEPTCPGRSLRSPVRGRPSAGWCGPSTTGPRPVAPAPRGTSWSSDRG